MTEEYDGNPVRTDVGCVGRLSLFLGEFEVDFWRQLN